MKKIFWHHESTESSLKKLNTSKQGLAAIEAKKRLAKYGKNEILIGKKKSAWQKCLNQFNNILIYILIISAIITALLQHWVDSSVIAGVVILNALIGYIQEGKAEKAIESLKKMLSLQANIVREGKRMRVMAFELVPGDIVFLRAGDKVPADLRLLKSNSLQVDESILTGESTPVDKNTQAVAQKTALSERQCMAYSGTFVTYGTGVGAIVATGKNTEVGRISSMLKGFPKLSTPLLRQITIFGHWIAAIILSFSFAIFLFGTFVRDYPLKEMFIAAVAIAVSIIPEGLPAIITIALAVGVMRMAKRHAIVRRLASVETLSSVTVICTDKTGTLTKNELTIKHIVMRDTDYEISGSGYNDEGKIIQYKQNIQSQAHPELIKLIRAGILCNEAELRKEDGSWHLIGNPMDGALLSLGLKANLHAKNEMAYYPRTDAIPFDSQHKFMASLHHDHKGNSYIFVKGAPEKILSMCSQQSEEDKSYWSTKINELAKKGMRVLAIASGKTHDEQVTLSFKDVEKNLTLIGLVGIIDPPREEACNAVKQCQQAGMRVIMITGDHPLTAQAIAKQVGIRGTRLLSGENLDVMTDEMLAEIVDEVDIYVRTVPKHKLRLIKALQSRHHIVAMTGDGVNDAPALKSANIGIAMGIKGTDVAKEAAEIVLADDNFASIEHAVKEGRNVYNNLKKAILFTLPSSGGEGFSVFFAILLGYTLPITPVQILWVNMITTVTLALALAFERPEKNLMQKKPRNPHEPLLSKFLIWRTIFVSFLFVLSMFGLFIYETSQGANLVTARTMVVNVLAFLEAIYLLNCRRIHDSVLNKNGLWGSKLALCAISLIILFQLGFTYLPFMQFFFKTQALNLTQWGIIGTITGIVFLIIEAEKTLLRQQYKKQKAHFHENN